MSKTPEPADALQVAVQRASSQSALARLCGVSQPAVSKWVRQGKHLPAEHVLTVERATGVSRHLLRPDLYPAESPASLSAPGGLVGGGASTVSGDRRAISPHTVRP
nr:YdaS family helix-turn-helix protein [uncultured Sphingomonas sp.]